MNAPAVGAVEAVSVVQLLRSGGGFELPATQALPNRIDAAISKGGNSSAVWSHSCRSGKDRPL